MYTLFMSEGLALTQNTTTEDMKMTAYTMNQNQNYQDESDKSTDTEIWEAWLEGDRENGVVFEVACSDKFDIVEIAALTMGIDVCESINVRRCK